MMTGKLRFWGCLLALQLGLALLLWWRALWPQADVSAEPLLDLNTAEISALEITAGDESVRLQRKGDGWVLPASDSAPADSSKVDSLLRDLAALTVTWPVADTAASAARFEVGADKPQRSITMFAGDQQLARLFMGTSPGLRKVHIRVDGQDAIYPVELAHHQVPANSDGWLPPPPPAEPKPEAAELPGAPAGTEASVAPAATVSEAPQPASNPAP